MKVVPSAVKIKRIFFAINETILLSTFSITIPVISHKKRSGGKKPKVIARFLSRSATNWSYKYSKLELNFVRTNPSNKERVY